MSIFSVLSSDQGFLALLVLCIAVVGAAYTMLGGLRGNLLANELQNSVKVLTVVVLIGFLWYALAKRGFSIAGPISEGGGFNIASVLRSHKRVIPTLGGGGLIANGVFSLVWQFVDMSCWQSLAATNDEEPTALSSTLLNSAFWIFLFPGLFGTVIGILLTGIPNLDSNTVMLSIFAGTLQNRWITFLVTAGFVAAVLSTIDGLLLAAGQAVSWDLTRQKEIRSVLRFWQTAPKSEDTASSEVYREVVPAEIRTKERSILIHTRTAIIVLALVGASSFLWIQSKGVSLFNLVYFAYCGQMVLLPTVLGCLTGWRVRKGSGLMSICLGLLTGFTSAFRGMLLNSDTLLAWSPVLALAGAFAGLIIFTSKFEPEVAL